MNLEQHAGARAPNPLIPPDNPAGQARRRARDHGRHAPRAARRGAYIEDNRIVAVGPTAELPETADEVLDLRGHLVIPGP